MIPHLLRRRLLLPLLLLLHLITIRAAPSTTTTTTIFPGCQATCGDIPVPYPFGIGTACYAPGFNLTCNTSSYPPKLLLTARSADYQILTISPTGTLTVTSPIASDCTNDDDTNLIATINLKSTPYTLSYARNRFTAIGCAAIGLMLTPKFFPDSTPASSGCYSQCLERDDVVAGQCTGMGCCQTAIPRGLKAVLVSAGLMRDNRTTGFSPCSYSFLVDADEYKFDVSDFYGLGKRRSGPSLVLDWAVGNRSCSEARRARELLCGANSVCSESVNGPGYRCSCNEGYEGNPYLAHGCQDIDECKDPKNNPCAEKCTNTPGSYICSCSRGSTGDGKKDGSGCNATSRTFPLLQLTLGLVAGCVFLILTGSLSYWRVKKRELAKLKQNFFRQNGGLLLQQQISSYEGAAETTKIFTTEELAKATDNYSDSRVLGKGGYGVVFKGVLPGNRAVAIKRSKIMGETQIEQFINEVVILSQIVHRNVVKILGCCLETEVPLLVYEYISNGTLFYHLHHPSRVSSLSWETRLRIGAETAAALAYLHSAAVTPIVHRDVKSANVLLDQNYTAKVSDFGASRLVPLGRAHVTTMVQGTLGYLDPEYFQTGQLTDKSDVYSFGVVLVELLTGEQPISSRRSEEERALANYFVLAVQRNRLFDVLEARVVNEGSRAQLEEIAELAVRCLGLTAEERPTMKEVAEELDKARGLRRSHPWAEEDSSDEEEVEGLLLGDEMSSSEDHHAEVEDLDSVALVSL